MMIHPKAILAVAPMVAKVETRYSIQGVRIERKGDRVLTIATNGKSMLIVSTQEAPPPTSSLAEISYEKGKDFAGVVMPAKVAVAAALACGTIHGHRVRVRECFGLDEATVAAGKRVMLETWRDKEPTQVKASMLAAKFPPYDGVLPKVHPDTHVAVTLDIGLLEDLIRSIKTVAPSNTYERGKSVTIFVKQKNANGSAVMFATGDSDMNAVGILMPINTADTDVYQKARL